MNQTKVWDDPIGSPRHLKELGLSQEILLLAVERGQAAYANCTANHPALYRGIVAWGETMCSLRESLIPEGWKRLDETNQPFVVNKGGTLAITVATGDENVGYKDKNPSTKSSKGPQTEIVVANNALANTLFGDIRTPESKKIEARFTWVLLFHRDEEKSETRCELSLPRKMNSDKQIDEWIERIILRAIPFSGSSVRISDEPAPQMPEIKIDIKRRA